MIALARRVDAAWVAVDGYHLGSAEYQHELRVGGLPVLLLDDDERFPSYEVDAVLNQNLDAETRAYRARADRTRLLLGSRYVLLRNEYLRVARNSVTRRTG